MILKGTRSMLGCCSFWVVVLLFVILVANSIKTAASTTMTVDDEMVHSSSSSYYSSTSKRQIPCSGSLTVVGGVCNPDSLQITCQEGTFCKRSTGRCEIEGE